MLPPREQNNKPNPYPNHCNTPNDTTAIAPAGTWLGKPTVLVLVLENVKELLKMVEVVEVFDGITDAC